MRSASRSQTTAPLEQMTVPVCPSWSCSGWSQRGGRPVTNTSSTPASRHAWNARTVRSLILPSWPRIVPSMSLATSRIQPVYVGRAGRPRVGRVSAEIAGPRRVRRKVPANWRVSGDLGRRPGSSARRAALSAFVDAGQRAPAQGVRGQLRFELRRGGALVQPGVRDVEGVDRDDVPVRAVAPGRRRPQVAGGAAVVLQLEGAGGRCPPWRDPAPAGRDVTSAGRSSTAQCQKPPRPGASGSNTVTA